MEQAYLGNILVAPAIITVILVPVTMQPFWGFAALSGNTPPNGLKEWRQSNALLLTP